MSSDLLSLFLLAASTGLAWMYYRHTSLPSIPESKSPPRLPIIGNLLQVPVHHPWVRFTEWKKTYGESHVITRTGLSASDNIFAFSGDIVCLKIFKRQLFVLNSRSIAIELFEKRSAIYSERARRPMAEL